MKRTPRKAEMEADTLWAKVVKLLNGPLCACGCGRQATNAHHIYSRKIKHLRHDPANGIALNAYCHKFSLDGPHQGPETFRTFLINRMGDQEYERLYHRSQMLKQAYDPKMSVIGLRAMLAELGGEE